MSHDGAVRSRPGDWVDFIDSNGVKYFDPTNLTYARAFDSLVMHADGKFQSTQGWWKNGTKGDLCECALALAWRDPAASEWAGFRDRLEKVVYAVIELETAFTLVDWQVRHGQFLWSAFIDELRRILSRRLADDDGEVRR